MAENEVERALTPQPRMVQVNGPESPPHSSGNLAPARGQAPLPGKADWRQEKAAMIKLKISHESCLPMDQQWEMGESL
jgi:hypothetical protein